MKGIKMKKLVLTIIILSYLVFPAHAIDKVGLTWDANTEPDLAGYIIHIGMKSREYTRFEDVGNVTKIVVENLQDGVNYFAATAYDTAGNKSGYSNEVSVPIDNTPPASPTGFKWVRVRINLSTGEVFLEITK